MPNLADTLRTTLRLRKVPQELADFFGSFKGKLPAKPIYYRSPAKKLRREITYMPPGKKLAQINAASWVDFLRDVELDGFIYIGSDEHNRCIICDTDGGGVYVIDQDCYATGTIAKHRIATSFQEFLATTGLAKDD